MSNRRAMEQRLLGQRAGVAETEWIEQPLAHHGVPHLAGDHFDDATEDREAGVAVRHRRPERVGLAERGAGLDVAFEAVIATAEVGEVVAVDPARVRQQVAQGDVLRHPRVGDGEVRQVGPHGCVDVDETLVGELHEHRRRPHLALRPDLEDGVGGRLHTGTPVGEPGRGRRHVTLVEYADGGAGDVVFLDELGQPRLELSERHRSTRRPWWRAVPRRGRSRSLRRRCARSSPSSLWPDRR